MYHHFEVTFNYLVPKQKKGNYTTTHYINCKKIIILYMKKENRNF